MQTSATIPDRTDEVLIRLGDRFVTPAAAHLHIFGVLLGAHLGAVGHVPDEDLETLPPDVRSDVHELVEAGVWWRSSAGYTIEPALAYTTMRTSLDRLNDPDRCVATGSHHVRGSGEGCLHCGATRV